MANAPLLRRDAQILPVIWVDDQSHDLRQIGTTGKSVCDLLFFQLSSGTPMSSPRTLEHDPDPKGRVGAKWKPVFPRDKRGTRLRGDRAQTKR